MNEIIKFKLKNIPHSPGCYLWKDKYNQVIYVGKAKDLFNRTHQYFLNDRDAKTKKLVQNIYDVEFIIVNNENESLILENNLIKKYQPKFNILLKEGSNYPYIAITKETNPRLVYTRNLNRKMIRYYGPFATNKVHRYEILNLLNKIFPLRKCNNLPNKKCLYYDIHQCLAPCINKISNNEYKTIIKKIDNFFNGETSELINELKQKEINYANQFDYESASQIRDLLIGINEIKNDQLVNLSNKHNIDFIGYSVKNNHLSIVIFVYINGKLLTKNQQLNELHTSIEDAIVSYLMQYYMNSNNKPKKCYVSLNKKLLKQLNNILHIEFINPIKGKNKEILLNAVTNAIEYYKSNYYQYLKNIELNDKAFEDFKKMLNMDNLNLVHMFDMSNLFMDDKIGAMIGIENGKFNKNLYRKFIIKDSSLKGDAQYMEEVIYREYSKVLKNKESLPNLIIADGGINQINAIKKSLKLLNLDNIIPVIGLAKNNKHQTNKIIINKDQYIDLDVHSNVYMYLSKIQDEVHRFAVSFFRKRKHQSLFKSILNDIDGLGSKSIAKIQTKYDNITDLKNAPVEELSQLVSKSIAQKIKNTLK